MGDHKNVGLEFEKDSLIEAGKKYYWLPNGKDSSYFDHEGAIVVSTDGCYFVDIGGNRILDSLGCQSSSTLGYNNMEIVDAMNNQMRSMTSIISGWPASPIQILLAEKIAQLSPGSLNKVFYGCNGSDANEAAIKISRQYWKALGKGSKFKIISRWHSYHGAHSGSGAASGYPWRRKSFEPLPAGYIHTRPPYCYQCVYDLSYPDCEAKCADEVRYTIENEDPSTVAAWIGDLAITALGFAPAPQKYVEKIREICTEYDVLMIVDEVITAFGRTGSWFFTEQYGVIPDIITIGKGLTSGYMPLSATLVKDEISDVFVGENGLHHVYTFAGTPASCSAALANINILERENVLEEVKEKGEWVASRLNEMQHELIANWNCTGLAFSVELAENKHTKKPFASHSLNNQIIKSGLNKGVLLYPMGKQPIINFAPPLIISYDELDEIFKALKSTLDEIKESL